MTMSASEAYDDCIAQAREGARRQRAKMERESDETMAVLCDTAAITLESFADMLVKMKAIRCSP